jgi:elongation factor G
MKDYAALEVRNIVLLGHSGVGKTSLVESMLYFTKVIDRMGRTVDGNSSLDFEADEVKKGLSIYTALAPIEWKDHKINFIDTPGFLDYAQEMEAGLAVADNALIVVGAKEGIQTGTIRAVRNVARRKLPTIFFVNKIDEENASFDKAYAGLRDTFGKSVIPFEIPIVEGGKVVGSVNILKNKAWYINDRNTPKDVPASMHKQVDEYLNQITEAVAETSDELLDKFFSGETFTDAELIQGVRAGVRSGEIRPVYAGSALQQVGIERLLDLIGEYFPSYGEKGLIEAKKPNREVVQLHTDESEPFSALVYKTVIDPFVGRISYIKVMTGVLSADSVVVNVREEKPEKIAGLFIVKGKNQIAVGKLFTGDLGCVVKLQVTKTNDTLATKGKEVSFDPIVFPEGLLAMAIFAKSKNDEDKLGTALQRIEEEDPSCKILKNAETSEMVVYGIGDQHLDVIVNKLRNKYKVEVELREPTIPYRETIRGTVSVEGKHKKQSGGAGQFGDVWITFEPCDSEDMVFEEKVFGGAVPRQYFPAVEAGLRDAMNKGVLAGYKVVGVKATLTDGKYHPVDSKEIAFKMAARLAYKAGMPQAKPVLLEPIVKLQVTVPDEYTGAVIGDFNTRRGIILGMEANDEGEQVISAEVPMSEVMRYSTELRSFTQGRGVYTQTFDRYEVAPPMIADKVIAAAAKHKQDDDDEE